MKTTLSYIFDTANANEIENLANKISAPKVSADVLASVKQKVYAKTGIAKTRKSNFFPQHWQAYVAAAACICLVIGVLFGTGVLPVRKTTIFQDDTVSVKEVTPSEEAKYTVMEWLQYTPKDYFGVPVIIATGKIKNLRDIEVEYEYYGGKKTNRMALFEFEVTEYLLNTSSVPSKQVLTVGHAFESDELVQDVPVLAEGKEFLLFLQQPDDMMPSGKTDPMKRSSYMDAHILGPYHLMCEKVDGAYMIAPSLRTHCASAKKVTKTEKMKQIAAERGTQKWTGFAAECKDVERFIKEAAEAYLREVS